MFDQNKEVKEELSELNILFEKICNKYKNPSDEYLYSDRLKEYLLEPSTKNETEEQI